VKEVKDILAKIILYLVSLWVLLTQIMIGWDPYPFNLI